MFGNNKRGSRWNLPPAFQTLPFGLRRSQMRLREPDGVFKSIEPEHVQQWLPQRMLFAGMHKLPGSSSSPMSPINAQRPSGTFARTIARKPIPGNLEMQPAWRVAQTKMVQMQVRPPVYQTPSNIPTEREMLNEMSRSMPRMAGRIDPQSLTQQVEDQRVINQAGNQLRAARMGAAITQAMQQKLGWGRK